MIPFRLTAALAALSLAAATPVMGQALTEASLTNSLPAAPAAALNVAATPAPSTQGRGPNGAGSATPTWQTRFERWGDFKEFSFSFRYRNQFDNDGAHSFDNGQQRSQIVGRFKFDPEGKYAIHAHVSSGRSFNWAYSDEINTDYLDREAATVASLSPAQSASVSAAAIADPAALAQASTAPSRGWGMSFRQLYFSASPVKQLSFEYGSLGIEKGESTEATTYDDDGYIAGERIRVSDPQHLFFDQVAITYAYEGDIYTPSFFERGQRLGQSNYHQFLGDKHFGSRLAVSTDYSFDKGTHTVREAAFVKVPETKALDSVRVELYQRLNNHVLSGGTFYAHQGVAVTGSRTFFKQFQLDGGFAHIDQDYGVLTGSRLLAAVGFSMNGDSYLTGSRAFTRGNWRLRNGVNLFGYYTHTVTQTPTGVLQLDQQGLTGGMTLDFSKALFAKKAAY